MLTKDPLKSQDGAVDGVQHMEQCVWVQITGGKLLDAYYWVQITGLGANYCTSMNLTELP